MKSFLKNLKVHSLAPYIVILLGFFTYFINYENPPHLFWDENYYVTAVEKYKKDIFFQESHPPLGKLIMHLGEKIWNPNEGLSLDFEKSDFARNLPLGYSFKGVRFFPVFFAWLNCLVFFYLLLSLTRSTGWSLSLSSLLLFDNALIVHSRGAMLDSIQIFGILMALLSFFKIYQDKKFSVLWSISLGISIAWATWTKLNGLIIILLIPLLVLHLQDKSILSRLKKVLPVTGITLLSGFIFSIFVWQSHFSQSLNPIPELNNEGWYRASDELKDIKLNPEGNPNPIRNFYIEFRDYLEYIGNYATGVPRLNLCKKGENGSPFFWWPFGARSINYRWETPNKGEEVSYLYLVPNPVVWGVALLAVILSFAFFLMKFFFGNISLGDDDLKATLVLLGLYSAYMLSIARIDRVMYTYHYFIPLIFSMALTAIWVPKLFEKLIKMGTKQFEVALQIIFSLCIAFAWNFYSPLTYYRPINCKDFKKRMLPGLQMKPIQCEDYKDKSIYQPIDPPQMRVQKSSSLENQRIKSSLPSKPQR